MNKKELERAIEDYEYHISGLKHLAIGHVEVHITDMDDADDERALVYADVTLVTQDKRDVFNGCTYPLSDILQRAEQLNAILNK